MLSLYLSGYVISLLVMHFRSWDEYKENPRIDMRAALLTAMIASLGWPLFVNKMLYGNNPSVFRRL